VIHHTSRAFWTRYEALPKQVQETADKSFALLKRDPRHPSLHFKRVRHYWSARIGTGFRALAVPVDDGLLWFWIGTHAEYDRLVE